MSKDAAQNNPFSGLIKPYDAAINHYDFVIQDLSSEIYDPELQRTKQPVIDFLKTMRAQWKKCRDDAQRQIDNM